MKVQLFLMIIPLLCIWSNGAYRILCLLPYNGRSHFVMFGALCRGLAKKGHQVDVISHFPSKVPRANYTDVVSLEGTVKNVVNSFSIDYAISLNQDLIYSISTVFGTNLCHLMGNERMQKFIKNPPKYDAVITEYFGANCYLGFGHYLNAPVIAAISALDPANLDERIGNPLSNAFYPGCYTNPATLNTFWDRLENTMTNFVTARMFNYYTSWQTEIMRKYLGNDIPDIEEIEDNISLTLVNTHWSLHGIRPVTPALVEVAGLHCDEDELELTPELKKWMDDAKDGVVYFTLGSLVNIETLPEETILNIYKSLRKIAPTKVLMKIANKNQLPPGLPDNVITLPWIPQAPVLRHNNTRLFITHGGLMGSQEALCYGVPVIGIPLFADQIRNVNTFVHKRIGVLLEYNKINEQTMDKALDTVLNDPTYRMSMKRESAIFRDRPMSPMNTAIFWVEYVIRNGPYALKSPAVGMPWWQKHLIDVYVFLLISLSLMLYLIIVISKIMLRMIQKKKLIQNVNNVRYKKRD